MSENVRLPKYDKSHWRKGEWDDEPDRKDFIHAGFSCFILRNNLGSWCGYVGVPNTHPAYEKDYDDVDVSVHGGLTYANKCQGVICHIPEAGMPDDVWWLGFDTCHYNDISPSRYLSSLIGGVVIAREDELGEYRNMDYVINETKQLADQLKEMK